MTEIQKDIEQILKQELEYRDGDYSQWIVGISIRKLGTGRAAKEGVYTARVVVKTNESPYVDGMDILFKANGDNIEIDPLYYENTPEYQGGEDAVEWLKRNGEVVYRQMEDPFNTLKRGKWKETRVGDIIELRNKDENTEGKGGGQLSSRKKSSKKKGAEKAKNQVTHPHDITFKDLFGRKEIAKDFIKNNLPDDVLEAINLDSMERKDGTCVGKGLEETFTDLIYGLKINNRGIYIAAFGAQVISGQDGYISSHKVCIRCMDKAG